MARQGEQCQVCVRKVLYERELRLQRHRACPQLSLKLRPLLHPELKAPTLGVEQKHRSTARLRIVPIGPGHDQVLLTGLVLRT